MTAGRRIVLGTIAAALAAPRPVGAQGGAQGGTLGGAEWPPDRVTIVTSLPAGSTVDITTRIYAERLAQAWGKPVVVDNRGGGNGVLACQVVARAKPDGTTLLATSAMTHAANPALYERLPYDPVADFAAVARFGQSPFVLMAHKGLGAATPAALIALLKEAPGRYNFGDGSVPARLAGELFLQVAGAEAVRVGYRGNQAGFPDLVNGRLAFMAVDVVGAKPLVDRGEVAALALSAPDRHPAVPEVPGCAEARLPGWDFTTWSGIYAPRATPPAVLARIHRDMVEAFATPEVRARIEGLGGSREPPLGPEEFQAFTIAEIAAWGRIIRQAGIRNE
jgi:tripartite-type tricarboxylate transporter receptor subunit TctC